MLKHMAFEWEPLDGGTWRVKVIGGWIIRSVSTFEMTIAESMVFIADRDHEWKITEPKADPIVEQSTLAQDFASSGL